MTILCIICAVFLVTAIFSVTDMMIRTESSIMLSKHGNWHLQLDHISQDIAEEICRRTDVTAVGASSVFNYDGGQPYRIREKKAVLYGTEETYMNQISNGITDGAFPQNDSEVMLSPNAVTAFGAQIGDNVTLHTPAGDATFTISGFGTEDKGYYENQTYLVGVYMTQTAFASIMENNGITDNEPAYYVQFEDAAKASGTISEIKEQYGLPEDSISENTAVMGIAGQSSNTSMNSIYRIAAILFVLVLLAGVLMIAGSMNSNVTQRTKFFGMMRCIGASRRQIIRFVRLEALNWCKTAVPAGLILGTAISWGVCALLHYIGGEFAAIPIFALSPVGLIFGAAVGIATVLLASQSPAERAAKVSPMAAVSGNTETMPSVRHTLKLSFGKVEWTLGIYHATASKKNWFLLTASFSLSIVLFLCFSVGLDFAHALLPTLRPWQPDIVLNGYANALVLDQNLFNEISAVSGVEHIFGVSYMDNISASSSRDGVDHVNLTSYSNFLLDSSADSVVEGDISAIYGNSGQVMTIRNTDNPLKVGDTIQIAGKEVEITCAVSAGLYSSEYGIICSQETFEWLTSEQNYNMIGVQLGKNASDGTVRQINNLVEGSVIFSDLRESNQEDTTTYLATQFVMYCFLAIIAMITMFNIINSISVSVASRIKQYGAMRAIGMDGRQLKQMIAAEAFTYAVSGLAVGCGAGLALNRFLHIKLLTRYFGIAWSLPLKLLCIIVVFDMVSAVIAVYAPSKRIRSMAITETINEL